MGAEPHNNVNKNDMTTLRVGIVFFFLLQLLAL